MGSTTVIKHVERHGDGSYFSFTAGSSASVEYFYNANGNMTTDSNKGVSFTTTDYCGNLLFENGELSRLLVDGGYVTFSNGTPHYHFDLRDHLGSSRVVLSETGAVEQETHYYPFGGLMADLSAGQDVQRHKYNGKELDRMHGLDWYDYGARHYDAIIGRWTTMDPLCEKYYDVSPYANCFGNPVKYVDIYGMAPGDRFKNPIQAAIDFGITYNVESIQTNKELSSFIYKMKDKNGKTYNDYPHLSVSISSSKIYIKRSVANASTLRM